MTFFKSLSFFCTLAMLLPACNTGPKVVEASQEEPVQQESSGIFSEPVPSNPASSSFPEELHKVTVVEVLPASRYAYLHVHEGEKHFWIATRKQDFEVGGTYYYTSGILKTHFESKEFNRVFEEIYLVSKLVPEKHGQHASPGMLPGASATAPVEEAGPSDNAEKAPIQVAGSLPIAELVKNPSKYEGKVVQVSGRCVKVNPNIMERNWIHLQDGSADDFDLVITSDSYVHEGAVLTMKATVSLDKDFGAGYRYDLILENGSLVP